MTFPPHRASLVVAHASSSTCYDPSWPMAAALLQHHAMGRVTVRSTGSEPAEKGNPAAAAVLAE